MSVSPVGPNGQDPVRAIYRRLHASAQHSQQQRTKNTEKTEDRFELEKQTKPETSPPRQRPEDNPNRLDFFVASVEKLNQGNNRAMHTYHQVGNYEKQQVVRESFGVDVYA